jgi:dihydrofolate reductase
LAKLIYSAIASLDGYVADELGNFDWAAPDAELHGFVNELERPIGTYLYGRRMYEVMSAWETLGTGEGEAAELRDYAEIWRAAEKIVYSTTLASVSTSRTRIERRFDPDAIEEIKASATSDISLGGPELAGHGLRAGLVDECHLFLNPIIVGTGTPALPSDLRIQLELLDESRFGSGVVHLHYGIGH